MDAREYPVHMPPGLGSLKWVEHRCSVHSGNQVVFYRRWWWFLEISTWALLQCLMIPVSRYSLEGKLDKPQFAMTSALSHSPNSLQAGQGYSHCQR